MGKHFEAGFFANNRQQLRNIFTGTAPIVLTAHGQLQSSSDMTFPFRQDSNFWYLTGLNEPDIILVMDKDKEYLVLPEHFDWRSSFEGAPSVADMIKLSGIETVLDSKAGWKRLGVRLNKVKHAATLAAPPAFVAGHGFYTNPARARLHEQIKSYNQDIELLDLKQHLVTMRMTKQPAELNAIRDAIGVTERSLKALLRKSWTIENTEADIETAILENFSSFGAEQVAFDCVVGAGPHSVIPHWKADQTTLPKKGLVVLDVGAQMHQYAADITRTFALGSPSRRMQRVYDAVLDAHTYALTLLKPGVVLKEYELDMMRYMGEKLRELGLIKSIEPAEVRKYFPHYTTHHLGLDAHDDSDYAVPLKPNMVLTVEPGIYIAKEAIGVRIEDDVLITENGAEILSDGLSRELKSLTMKEAKKL